MNIKELEEELKNIDKKYGNRVDEFAIAQNLSTQIQTLKDVVKLIEVLQTKKPYNERNFDDLQELKQKIQGEN